MRGSKSLNASDKPIHLLGMHVPQRFGLATGQRQLPSELLKFYMEQLKLGVIILLCHRCLAW